MAKTGNQPFCHWEDGGSYILVLRVIKTENIRVGRLGRVCFEKGYYLYAGSAVSGLASRIQRHVRQKKRVHWHIDVLRKKSRYCYAFALNSCFRLECKIAEALLDVSEWTIPGFGSSDCRCKSHLFGMSRDPLRSKEFRRIIRRFGLFRFEG